MKTKKPYTQPEITVYELDDKIMTDFGWSVRQGEDDKGDLPIDGKETDFDDSDNDFNGGWSGAFSSRVDFDDDDLDK